MEHEATQEAPILSLPPEMLIAVFSLFLPHYLSDLVRGEELRCSNNIEPNLPLEASEVSHWFHKLSYDEHLCKVRLIPPKTGYLTKCRSYNISISLRHLYQTHSQAGG